MDTANHVIVVGGPEESEELLAISLDDGEAIPLFDSIDEADEFLGSTGEFGEDWTALEVSGRDLIQLLEYQGEEVEYVRPKPAARTPDGRDGSPGYPARGDDFTPRTPGERDRTDYGKQKLLEAVVPSLGLVTFHGRHAHAVPGTKGEAGLGFYVVAGREGKSVAPRYRGEN